MKDIHTSFIEIYPSDTKAADQVLISLQHFLGNARVKTFYSDDAREIIKAVQDLGFGGHHELSQPGMPQTNGIAERAVQEVLSGTRTLLVQAGLPGYFWSKASVCYCMLHNTRVFLIFIACKRATLPMAQTS